MFNNFCFNIIVIPFKVSLLKKYGTFFVTTPNDIRYCLMYGLSGLELTIF